MIHCRRNNTSCYYTNGVGCVNIPFQYAERIEIQKITIYGNKKYTHNFLPVLLKFQKRLRSYIRWLGYQRCVKAILKRELIGRTPSWAYHPVE